MNNDQTEKNKEIKQNVLILGLISFFNDISSEMIFPLIPLFVTVVLGASKEALGLIEGIADSIGSLSEIVTGYISDRIEKRKNLVVLGYTVSGVMKTGLLFASSWPIVLVIRGFERIGKGIRTPARDSILSSSVEKENIGKAFGFHRMMDTLGAIVGPIIAYIIMSNIANTESALRSVFGFALIPACIGVVLALLLIREPDKQVENKSKRAGFWQSIKELTPDYKKYLKISVLFSLSYFSFAFLIVRASEIGLSIQDVALVYLIYNIVYALVSVPAGVIADRFDPKKIVSASFVLYGVVLIGFAYANSFLLVAVFFALYGLFVSIDETVNKTYISRAVEEQKRGMAFGTYNTATGAAYLPASILAGLVWTVYGSGILFTIAAGLAAVSGLLMLGSVKSKK